MTNNQPPFNAATSAQYEASLQLGRLILQLRKLESSPRVFGSAGALTPSEIHTIDAIGHDGAPLMKELAARLGITKGAVTQIVDRLAAKRLVVRAAHPQLPRGIVVSLTGIGKEAFRAHAEMHIAFYERLRASFSPDEIGIFEKCVAKLSEMLGE